MDIIAALYIDDIDLRPVAGGATHIDLTGVKFSGVAPEEPPFVWRTHMVVLVRCGTDESGTGALEVVFEINGAEVARNAQPVTVEPGKFAFRLVQAELSFDDYDTVEAHCRIDMGSVVVVPFTMLPVEPE